MPSRCSAVAVLLVYGLGAGLFQSPNISGVPGAAPGARLGVTSGTLSTVGRWARWWASLWLAACGTGAPRGLRRAVSQGSAQAFVALALFGLLATSASWLRDRVAAGPTPAAGRLADHPG